MIIGFQQSCISRPADKNLKIIFKQESTRRWCTAVRSVEQSKICPEGGCVPAGTPTLKSVEEGIFVTFGFCDGRIWTVGLSFIVAVGLVQRFRLEWRPKVRAGALAGDLLIYREMEGFFEILLTFNYLTSKLLFSLNPLPFPYRFRLFVLILFFAVSLATVVEVLTGVMPSIHDMLPSIHTLKVLDDFRFSLEFLRVVGLALCVRIMADEGVQRKIPVERNINWVADDPRTTPSKFEFEEHFPEDLFTDIEIPGHADWEVRIPGANQRICTTFKNGGFPMYQIAFEHMGLRLPFTDLEMAVFNHLEICPSQLHPNSLAFIRAFEIVASYLQLAPTVPLFFHIFGIQRSRPRGNVTDKCGWVSLKQHKKYFEIFEESLRGFKDKWYVVRPITSAGWKTILVRGPKVDDEGRVQHRDDGEPIEVDCERFPFCWTKRHYAREARSFTFKKGALSKEELADLKALDDFVEEFSPSLWEDREGNPICDEEGYQLSSKRFINTKALLRCSTRVEAEDLLREMKSTAATLRKLQADRKRRQAGGASSSAPDVAVDQRPPKHPRTQGGGGVIAGPRGLVPGRSAAEFVLPPAMGHDCLLDGQTTVKIPEADQTILESMGPESLKNVVAESSVAVFKLLEVATFLNGRECKFLQERDEARALAKGFGERLTVVEQDLLARDKALEGSEAEAAKARKELEDAKLEEERMKGKIAELEEKLASMTLAPSADEEEKKVDPAGTYTNFSRAGLISKIYEVGDLQLEVASSSFKNALAQLRILNPGVELITEGLDEMKEVVDGRIASPALDEEHRSRAVRGTARVFGWLPNWSRGKFLRLKLFLAALSVPSRAGCSAGLVLSDGGARMEYFPVEHGCASPRRDLQPSLKSMSNYAIFNCSIVLASQHSTCEEFLCHRDLRGGMLRFLFLLGHDMVLPN
ncbi:hypothetical protein TSUD_70440 [Trifolium subterraneum]|uniref:Transposase (putative) gypsy type domain-containing protein n=1 Tax=Trifolium subterraneum TaxID=3900 RepID=A0A2Z6M034_TRISU|nr:hypothetical protein TSUD_70440 [Trifolium subterraneum]